MARSREEHLKAKRETMARRRLANPQAVRDYQNRQYALNQAAYRAKMRQYSTRRFFWTKAMKLRGPVRPTTVDIARLWKKQRERCALSGRRLDRSAQLDHKLPKARGGLDVIDNLQWLSPEANLAKRAMTDAEFISLCHDIAAHSARACL